MTMASLEKICRLCLEVISESFEILDQLKVDMLENISLNLDLSLTDQSLVCSDCRDCLQESYNFKMTCLNNTYYVETFSGKLEPNHIEIVQTNTTEIAVKYETEICRLCLKRLSNDSFVKFKGQEPMFSKDMLQKCLPELETNVTNQLLVCNDCLKHCQNLFNFVENCLNTEMTIKGYAQTTGTRSNGLIYLSNVLKWTHDMQNYGIVKADAVFIKQESPVENFNSSTCVKTCKEVEDKVILKDPFKNTNCDVVVKNETFEELEMDYIDIKCEDDCLLEAETAIESNSSQENTGKSSTDETPYRCSQCNYSGKTKDYLRKHMLNHKDSSEITMYKCTECNYESKYNGNLRNHTLTHKAISEVALYSCSQCKYTSKYKSDLVRHSLTHKDKSEVEMHKCTLCRYESRRRHNLLRHMLTHEDRSGEPTLKCSQCSYESKQKEYLRQHMLVHKDVSEIMWYKCSECKFETKRKPYLREHLLKHKSKSEVTLYKCTKCSFESKYKCSLRTHTLLHKNDSGRLSKRKSKHKKGTELREMGTFSDFQ